MPDLVLCSIIFGSFLILFFCILFVLIEDKRPAKTIIFSAIVCVVCLAWFLSYMAQPWRFEKTYEVKAEYNSDKTMQFFKVKVPNSEESNDTKLLDTYKIFGRLVKDNETILVKQKDFGTYLGVFPITIHRNPRNICEINDNDENDENN